MSISPYNFSYNQGLKKRPLFNTCTSSSKTLGLLLSPKTVGLFSLPKTVGLVSLPKILGLFSLPKTLGLFPLPETLGLVSLPKTLGPFQKYCSVRDTTPRKTNLS